MKIIKGHDLVEINKTDYDNLKAKFEQIILDLGCGDGRFVYKGALENKNWFYIGVDPALKQIAEYNRKATRKKLNNILFVLGSIEQLPKELAYSIDKLYVIFPWGSLLQAIATPSKETTVNLCGLLKPNGNFETIFGYNTELEPSETERLVLNELDEQYIEDKILPIFTNEGLRLKALQKLNSNDLNNLESNWSKKVSTTSKRPFYKLVFEKTGDL